MYRKFRQAGWAGAGAAGVAKRPVADRASSAVAMTSFLFIKDSF
jgi:hypothetical protein